MNTMFKRKLGMLFDACQVITCKTIRRDSWIKSFVRNGNESNDLQYIEDVLTEFNELDPKLSLLGYVDKKKGSLINCIFKEYANNHIENWDTYSFINYLTDTERMKDLIAQFYFDRACTDDILNQISDSPYPYSIKAYLYDYFIFPQRYSTFIKETLTTFLLDIESYYDKHLPEIIDFQESFSYHEFAQKVPASHIKLNKKVTTYFISVSLISKYMILGENDNNFGWIVIGADYNNRLINKDVLPVDVATFGNAFGDKIRVKIVELIREHGEMTLADLSKEIGVVNTIAIYHLDILKKENLLLHRYQGRKVLYCLNTYQVERGLQALKVLCGLINESTN